MPRVFSQYSNWTCFSYRSQRINPLNAKSVSIILHSGAIICIKSPNRPFVLLHIRLQNKCQPINICRQHLLSSIHPLILLLRLPVYKHGRVLISPPSVSPSYAPVHVVRVLKLFHAFIYYYCAIKSAIRLNIPRAVYLSFLPCVYIYSPIHLFTHLHCFWRFVRWMTVCFYYRLTDSVLLHAKNYARGDRDRERDTWMYYIVAIVQQHSRGFKWQKIAHILQFIPIHLLVSKGNGGGVGCPESSLYSNPFIDFSCIK